LSKWGNDLRQSYRTLAQAAGVTELDIHLLKNHSLPGVNAGYIMRAKLLRDYLHKQQERISAVVVDKVVQIDCCKWILSAAVEAADTKRLSEAISQERERPGEPNWLTPEGHALS
jgi:hypothetical protein